MLTGRTLENSLETLTTTPRLESFGYLTASFDDVLFIIEKQFRKFNIKSNILILELSGSPIIKFSILIFN